MGVKLRITETGVPVVVRRGDDPDDVRLRHRTVASRHSPAGRGDLTLEEREDLFERLMVGFEDEGLGSASATPHSAETDFGTLKVKS